MEANVTATLDDFVQSQRGQHINSRKNSNDLSALTQRFRDALKKSVAGIIEAGRVLIEAKKKLPRGQFTNWVVRELRFGTRKDGSREADLRKAEMLMLLARNEVISNPCHWHALPPSPRTLYELTQVSPAQRLLKLIEKGKVHAATTREEAIAFQPKSKRSSKGELKVAPPNCHSGGRVHPIGSSRLRTRSHSPPKAGEEESYRSNV